MKQETKDYLNGLATDEYLELVEQVRTENRNKWLAVIEKYRAKELSKKDVTELLREGQVPIPEALEVIASMLEGSGLPLKVGTRHKTIEVNGHYVSAREYTLGFIDALRDLGCGLEEAKEAALRLGVSRRSIENWRNGEA